MPPSLVIFDCDGVLVDSEPITNAMLAQDLTDHGLATTTEDCMRLFVGGTLASVAEKARGMGARLPGGWVDDFYERMFDALAEQVEAIPGVDGVLDALDAAGIPYCVGSNGPPNKMQITLGRTGLLARLQGRLFSAHTVGIAKPDPGLYLHAAHAMGHDPATTTVIEDSVSGVRAAAGAGMRCFGYVAETPADALVAHGAIPFDSMADLPGLLGLPGATPDGADR